MLAIGSFRLRGHEARQDIAEQFSVRRKAPSIAVHVVALLGCEFVYLPVGCAGSENTLRFGVGGFLDSCASSASVVRRRLLLLRLSFPRDHRLFCSACLVVREFLAHCRWWPCFVHRWFVPPLTARYKRPREPIRTGAQSPPRYPHTKGNKHYKEAHELEILGTAKKKPLPTLV